MLKLPRSQQRRLAEVADSTVRRTLAGEVGVPAAANLLEAIGATVSTALPAIGDAWGTLLHPRLQVNVVGAFSFGCPKVVVVAEKVRQSCDLASLLAIVDDLTSPVADRRAILLSARLRGGSTVSIQRQLYAEWPAFRFVDHAYRRGLRELGVAEAEPAARFVEIDLSTSGRTWTVLSGGAGGSARPSSLGAALAAMTVGASGRKATVDGEDPWSRMISELLNQTARAAVGGLGPESKVRSAVTYDGKCGSGLVVLENRENLPLEAAFAQAAARGHEFQEGPMSVAHVIFRRV